MALRRKVLAIAVLALGACQTTSPTLYPALGSLHETRSEAEVAHREMIAKVVRGVDKAPFAYSGKAIVFLRTVEDFVERGIAINVDHPDPTLLQHIANINHEVQLATFQGLKNSGLFETVGLTPLRGTVQPELGEAVHGIIYRIEGPALSNWYYFNAYGEQLSPVPIDFSKVFSSERLNKFIRDVGVIAGRRGARELQ